MANNANQVVIAPGGSIAVAPVGTAAPVDEVVALAAAWKDLGYVTEDGVTWNFGITKNNVGAWQAMFPIRRSKTGAAANVNFALRQWNKDTVPLAFGGGQVTVPTAGHYKYAPPQAADAIDERAMCVSWVDGSKHYRLIVLKLSLSDPTETQINKTDPADLPMAFEVYGADTGDPWYMLTDDPAFQ